MREYIFRFFVVAIMALCVGLLFLGGKQAHAQVVNTKENTNQWIWPSDGIITDVFGTRNGQHKGIDIAGSLKTPIYAADQGTVTKSYYSNTYGHVIFVKHDNGFETVYAHLNNRLASKGDKVKQGAKIGEMGNTGDSSGVHLHFEIHESEWTFDKENALDPIAYLGDVQIGETVSALAKSPSTESMETLAGMGKQNKDMGKNKNQVIHIVKQGDTIWSIARQYNSNMNSITHINGIDDHIIIPGQEIIIK